MSVALIIFLSAWTPMFIIVCYAARLEWKNHIDTISPNRGGM